MTAPKLTVVIPVHNEAGNIGPLLEETLAAFSSQPIEVVVVDDQSLDGSIEEILLVRTENPGIRLLRHQQRAGKSRALVTGFAAARGEWIGTLDGDGQNDPKDLARIWVAYKQRPASLIVAGVRRRRNDGTVKWLTSRVANFVRKRMLRDDCRDTACGLKFMPAQFAKGAPYFDNMHRFFPAIARRAGLEVIEEVIDDRPRQHGASKYGFFDRASVALFDLFGVFWLVRRYSDPGDVAEEVSVEAGEPTRSNI
ncbi:MAG: glycosyltransferase family 2 protein [Rhodobacteraceae bacterium]|nr:glycosyltransferase family 2 protein [Paracoccaceae bacterium]